MISNTMENSQRISTEHNQEKQIDEILKKILAARS
jgi:hypothetical protein